MKKNLLLFISLVVMGISVKAQTFEMRTFLNDYDYIAVQLRQTALGSQPDALSTADGINDLVFTLRWAQSLGDVDVDVICTTYNIVESGSRTTKDTYYYQQFGANVAFNSPDNYIIGQWVTIATIENNFAGSTSGTFELAPDGWAGNLLVTIDWNAAGSSTQYNPTLITGDCDNTPIPTIVYDYVWLGGGQAGFESDWFFGGNWTTACGAAQSASPTAVNNLYIPDVSAASGYFPNANLAASMNCKNLRIASGASCSVPATNGNLNIAEELRTYGSLIITPNANATVTGNTYINGAASIEIQATSSGAGSFIDNGTITYGTSGTAKVQTFLSNSAGSGNFDIHFVGPTVDEENYTGGGTGAFLSAFDLANGSTYAYSWDETQANVSGWQNISSNTYEVRTADGIGLSSTDNANHTLEMTGALVTGNVSSPALTYSNNHYELISNPYPSSIDFDNLATDNTTVVQNKYWIWNPAANNYVNRSGGSGGSQYIQVGQGFIVETKQAGTFDFTNSRRAHSNDAFRETIPFELTIVASGGMPGYNSEAIVRFTENATNNYDIEWDGEFWESQNSDATSVRSVTEDGIQASVNMFSLESLSAGSMFSVPVKFDCGYTTQYTLDFSGFESFEYGTEVYLEDIQTGDEWVYLNDNPVYTFDAAEYQGSDRFILHFFGPTGIDENKVDDIQIYSYERNAFVKNNGNEKIKIVYVFNMASELMMKLRVPENQKLNRFFVSDQRGYYIIKVITNENVYTEKVLIY